MIRIFDKLTHHKFFDFFNLFTYMTVEMTNSDSV